MALARCETTAATTKPMSSFAVRLWPPGTGDQPPKPLNPGDLVVLRVLEPQANAFVVGPSGWTAAEGAWALNVFWKVLNDSDGPEVTFWASFPYRWEVEVWVLPAGTYSPPRSGEGSAVPWRPAQG